MPHPKTYLLIAPSDSQNPFGSPMSITDLLKGLRMANPNLQMPLPEHFERDYPGKKAEMTCLWLGQPPTYEGAKQVGGFGSVKITALTLSPMIPEYTQIAEGGTIVQKGWRAVLEKVARSGAASKRELERVFKVTLELEGRDVWCEPCLQGGLRRKGQGKNNVCLDHESVDQNVVEFKQVKEEAKWLVSKWKGSLSAEVSRGVRKLGLNRFLSGGSSGKAVREALSRETLTRGNTGLRCAILPQAESGRQSITTKSS